jgi:hypothetical protein
MRLVRENITLTLTVMDRDRRLTGYLRGQTDNAIAPAGFELNNPWSVSLSFLHTVPAEADL